MNIQNRVFKKLAEAEKVELATQKVDLSIIGDAKKAVSDLNAKSKRLKDVQDEFNKAKMDVIFAKQKANKSLNLKSPFVGSFKINPFSVMDDIKSASKELGVDVKKIDGYGDLNNAIQDYELQLQKAEESRKELVRENK
tara:strand:+ start:4992 stop:5408 length:417 start_codon:yes stop_codon:yes gene_type:complete